MFKTAYLIHLKLYDDKNNLRVTHNDQSYFLSLSDNQGNIKLLWNKNIPSFWCTKKTLCKSL